MHAVVATDGALSVDVEDAATVAPELLRLLEHDGTAPQALSITQPTLEDVYLRSTGRSFDEIARAQADTDGRKGT